METRTVRFLDRPMRYIRCNTAIVGSGAAGFAAANRLFEQGQTDIVILTEGVNMGTSRNTGSDKQTYYKMNLCGSLEDSVESMAETYFAGESVDGDLALCEAANSLRCFFYLCECGVPFPFNEFGEFTGYKTDHDPAMRATSAGPLTSKYMTEGLERRARGHGIPIVDGVQIVSLIRDDTACRGLLALDRATGEWVLVNATNVVYATGGPAGIYSASVYPVSQSGSTGVALKAGVKAKNLTEWQYGITSVKFRWNLSGSYQQVLPRYISTDRDGNDPREFLQEGFADLTEMLNAQFLKGYQWPFDPRKTAAGGSSVVDILVYKEITEKNRRVWMDYRCNPTGLVTEGTEAFRETGETAFTYLKNCDCLLPTPIERLARMNPNAIDLYRSHGIDLYTEPLEVSVCAQHNNGGLAGDHWWESNLPHFFPIGEVNGSHGVYRPGGAALNSGQVGALRASTRIARAYRNAPLEDEPFFAAAALIAEEALAFADGLRQRKGRSPAAIRKELTQMMSRNCAHMRSAEKAEAAQAEIRRLRENLLREAGAQTAVELAEAFRVEDLLLTSEALAQSILAYISHGGGSRGSYLLEGCPPDEGRTAGEILEVEIRDGMPVCSWRPVRPIPAREQWFETMWREFRAANGLDS